MTIPDWTGGVAAALPVDADDALLFGRAHVPGRGPRVVTIRDGGVVDISNAFATARALTEASDPADALRAAEGPVLGSVEALLANTVPEQRDDTAPWLLSPIDLHVVKAAGVTFPVSMIERVIEERAGGDASRAEEIRIRVSAVIGDDLQSLVPGSHDARRLRRYLQDQGLWSQYLEVGIGPDAEVFTKAPVLSTVGTAVDVGVSEISAWNNPEPEVVLVVSSQGRIVGATLGNDVNLRDIEGRSALLLPRAKDNNASAALGPFVRLLDAGFRIDDLRATRVGLCIEGEDGFALDDTSDLALISRDPESLVRQTLGAHHQYPDGFVLYLGSLFAPIMDRDEPGHGFTHHLGDVVRIRAPRLGTLVNRVARSETLPPWTYGIAELIADLSAQHAAER